MRQLFAAAFALSLCVPSSAQISLNAQYQWVDQNGQMVFSDQPPPASVPLSRILRVGDPVAPAPTPAAANQLGNQTANASAGEAANASRLLPQGDRPDDQAALAPSPTTRKASLKDQMAAFEKRRAKRKADQRKKLKDAKLAKANAKSCARMKADKEKLESGVRVRTRDETGARRFMTENERFAHAKALEKRLKKCRA